MSNEAPVSAGAATSANAEGLGVPVAWIVVGNRDSFPLHVFPHQQSAAGRASEYRDASVCAYVPRSALEKLEHDLRCQVHVSKQRIAELEWRNAELRGLVQLTPDAPHEVLVREIRQILAASNELGALRNTKPVTLADRQRYEVQLLEYREREAALRDRVAHAEALLLKRGSTELLETLIARLDEVIAKLPKENG